MHRFAKQCFSTSIDIPTFIRVRDLSKLLRVPVDNLVQKACKKHYKKYYMEHAGVEYVFPGLKQIILPFPVARDIAHRYGLEANFEDVEPPEEQNMQGGKVAIRQPVVAVFGHINHGKTTFLDTLRGSNVAAREIEGITQTINVCEYKLNDGQSRVTFLDTPGHFHFFRMRSSAACYADAVVLMVAANEGCLRQTEECIGCIEELALPTVVAINKMDIAADRYESTLKVVRGFVATEDAPAFPIVAKDKASLHDMVQHLHGILLKNPKNALISGLQKCTCEATALEFSKIQGQGLRLRLINNHGSFQVGHHFVCGLIHGVVKAIRLANGEFQESTESGRVYDVMYSNKSRVHDAPIEMRVHFVPEQTATKLIDQRKMNFELQRCARPNPVEENEVENEPFECPVIVKADSAGSLASLLDTLELLPNVRIAHMGIGDINSTDVSMAEGLEEDPNSKVPIFGFKVKANHRERKMMKSKRIDFVHRPTVHQLIEDIETFVEKSKP